jgi:hypothetical protein
MKFFKEPNRTMKQLRELERRMGSRAYCKRLAEICQYLNVSTDDVDLDILVMHMKREVVVNEE